VAMSESGHWNSAGNMLIRREGYDMTVIHSRVVRVDLQNGRSAFEDVPVNMTDDDIVHKLANRIAAIIETAPNIRSVNLKIAESTPERLCIDAVIEEAIPRALNG
jgi:predicted membrane GTPase involved in stress response